jgi:hypothetical protein
MERSSGEKLVYLFTPAGRANRVELSTCDEWGCWVVTALRIGRRTIPLDLVAK